MPKDKDFKALVRALAAQTGQRYTEARAQLRPNDKSAGGERRAEPFDWFDWIVPTTLAEQRGVRRPPGQQRFSYLWPSVVEDGWLAVEVATEPGSPPVVAETALLTELAEGFGAIPFRTLGADRGVEIPSQGWSDDAEEGRWGLEQMSELSERLLGEPNGQFLTYGDDAPPAPLFGPIGSLNRDAEHPSRHHLQSGRRFVLDELLPDVHVAAGRVSEIGARLWTGYGLRLHLRGRFEIDGNETVRDRTLWRTSMPDRFWHEAAVLLTAASDSIGLPPLRPRQAMLCLESEGYIGTGGLAGPRAMRDYNVPLVSA